MSLLNNISGKNFRYIAQLNSDQSVSASTIRSSDGCRNLQDGLLLGPTCCFEEILRNVGFSLGL